MIQRKKRIHTGAEQFDIGIHGAKLPEFYVPDIGLIGDTDVDIEDDTGLFDVLGTDDNSNNRYMRPRICHMPSECVRYENAEQLARDLKITTGIRIDTFVSGSFVFGHFQGVGVPFSRVIVESHPFGWGILYPSHTKRTI